MGFTEGNTGRATLVLAGPHTATVNVMAAGSAEARLTILWAAGMLTFTTTDQVTALADALTGSRGARGLVPGCVGRGVFELFVPRYGHTTTAATLGATPTVRVTPNSDDATGRGGWAHRLRWIDVDTGPITFRVLDTLGFDTLTAQVTDAAEIAAVTLRPAHVVPRTTGPTLEPTTEPTEPAGAGTTGGR